MTRAQTEWQRLTGQQRTHTISTSPAPRTTLDISKVQHFGAVKATFRFTVVTKKYWTVFTQSSSRLAQSSLYSLNFTPTPEVNYFISIEKYKWQISSIKWTRSTDLLFLQYQWARSTSVRNYCRGFQNSTVIFHSHYCSAYATDWPGDSPTGPAGKFPVNLWLGKARSQARNQ